MTTPSASGADEGGLRGQDRDRRRAARPGQGVFCWYQATRLARASASCRYRMGNLAELLRGLTTVVDPRPPSWLFREAEVVVVVRPFVDGAAESVLAVLRRRGVRLIGDFDDLLFSGDPAEYPLVRSGALDRAECARRIVRYRRGLEQFDAFTVATEPLAEFVRTVEPDTPVQVVPNGVSPGWLAQGEALYPPWRRGDPKVIRFLPGSPSHDADFAQIADTVAAFVRDHAEVSLEVVGPLELPEPQQFGGRLHHVAPVPFAELPRLLASSWVTLAPLAPSQFNRCKSGIKFLESAAFGTPCIATPSPDMERHAGGGVVLARDARDWREALEQLLDDEHRSELSRKGRTYVAAEGTARHGAATFRNWSQRWARG